MVHRPPYSETHWSFVTTPMPLPCFAHLPDWQNHLLRVVLLACQSGRWSKSSSQNATSVMYLDGFNNSPNWGNAGADGIPANCPTEWIEVDSRTASFYGSAFTNRRTCIHPLKICTVVYLDGWNNSYFWGNSGGSNIPALCPTGWTQADARSIAGNNRRTCYKC